MNVLYATDEPAGDEDQLTGNVWSAAGLQGKSSGTRCAFFFFVENSLSDPKDLLIPFIGTTMKACSPSSCSMSAFGLKSSIELSLLRYAGQFCRPELLDPRYPVQTDTKYDAPTFRHSAGTRYSFPLEMARGTLSCRPERIPTMAALATPAKIIGGLEEARRTTNEPAVGTSHRRTVRLRAMYSPLCSSRR